MDDNYELNVEAVVGIKSVNIYVEEKLEDVERTVCILYYVGEKAMYKHFVYLIPAGKTHITINDLLTGTYEIHAIQISQTGKVEGKVRFNFTETSSDLLYLLEGILENLDDIHDSISDTNKSNRN